jgi:hypothetical protein
MLKRVLLSALALATSTAADARPAAKVMLLGTYHLANNNRDLVNLPIEDVLTVERQREIRELVDGLARWQPTRIAIEWPYDDQAGLDRRYADFLANRLAPSANERDQIGLRLAKKLGLAKVHAIDWNGSAPGAASDYDFPDWARRHGQSSRFDTLIRKEQADANRMAATMRGQSISQWFRALNSPESRLRLHQPYFTLASFGSNNNNPGAAWVGSWYARNLRIFNNLRGILGNDERVLVLYGVGHAYLLDRFIKESNAAEQVDPRRYMP